MNLLPLDDPRWTELTHRTWPPRGAAGTERHASDVPRELSRRLDDPDDLPRFKRPVA